VDGDVAHVAVGEAGPAEVEADDAPARGAQEALEELSDMGVLEVELEM
jgi:hypothetical protein